MRGRLWRFIFTLELAIPGNKKVWHGAAVIPPYQSIWSSSYLIHINDSWPLRWQVPNKALQLLEQYSKESRSLWFDIKACSRSRLFMSTLLLSETRFPGQSWVKRVVSVPAKQQASTWKIWVFSPNGVIRHHRCRVLTAIPKYRYSYWPGFGVATQRPGCFQIRWRLKTCWWISLGCELKMTSR